MKETIFKKSLELFTTNGVKTVTMDDIAHELGISKKTIYLHFSSKKELFEETIEFVFDSAINRMKSVIGNCENPIQEHFAMKGSVADLFGLTIQTTMIYQFNKYYPKIAERIQKKRHDNYDLTILRNLQEGVKQGYYRADIDIDFVGKMFFSSLTAFLNDEHFDHLQNNQTIDELNYKFLEYHLRGIVTPKGLEILEELLKKQK